MYEDEAALSGRYSPVQNYPGSVVIICDVNRVCSRFHQLTGYFLSQPGNAVEADGNPARRFLLFKAVGEFIFW